MLPFDAEAFETCKNTIKLFDLCAPSCLGLGKGVKILSWVPPKTITFLTSPLIHSAQSSAVSLTKEKVSLGKNFGVTTRNNSDLIISGHRRSLNYKPVFGMGMKL